MKKPAGSGKRRELQEKLKKGDLIRYDGHISIFYSERWGKSRFHSEWGTNYDIIHASGYENIQYKIGSMKSPRLFNRKVTVNGIGDSIQKKKLKNPTGFGRIKLWD